MLLIDAPATWGANPDTAGVNAESGIYNCRWGKGKLERGNEMPTAREEFPRLRQQAN